MFSPAYDQLPGDRPRVRLDAVDILRGLVMVIMMLDHTRDMVNATSFQSLAAGKSVAFLFMNPQDLFTHVPPGAGFPLWVTWVAWIVGVVLLYPVCTWYAGVKARRRDWWFAYL